MKIIIIEDEKLTAEDLAGTIRRLQPAAEIIKILPSVKEAKSYLSNLKEHADLIFSDIQLGDGTAFDIFEKTAVTIPVIFCTAYDEYALEAFKANGINYILKPFSDEMIADALAKYTLLKETMATAMPETSDETQHAASAKTDNTFSALVLHEQDKIVRIPQEDIAFICFKNGSAHVNTFDQKSYLLNKSMDELEKGLSNSFYRLNRQYLVNKNAIAEVMNSDYRKLSVSLLSAPEEQVIVSKEKKSGFLNWFKL